MNWHCGRFGFLNWLTDSEVYCIWIPFGYTHVVQPNCHPISCINGMLTYTLVEQNPMHHPGWLWKTWNLTRHWRHPASHLVRWHVAPWPSGSSGAQKKSAVSHGQGSHQPLGLVHVPKMSILDHGYSKKTQHIMTDPKCRTGNYMWLYSPWNIYIYIIG